MAPVQHKSVLTFLPSSFFPPQLRDRISRGMAVLPRRRTRSRANGGHRRVKSHCWLQLEQRSLEGSSPTCWRSQPPLGKGKKRVRQGEPQAQTWAEGTSYQEMVCLSQGFLEKQNQKDTHLYSKRFISRNWLTWLWRLHGSKSDRGLWEAWDSGESYSSGPKAVCWRTRKSQYCREVQGQS